MRGLLLKDVIGVFILAATAAIMIVVSQKMEKVNKSSMYEIELEKVTIWCDTDGVVKNASKDKSTWIQRAVINIKKLEKGSQLMAYDLSTDVITSEVHTVKSIIHP